MAAHASPLFWGSSSCSGFFLLRLLLEVALSTPRINVVVGFACFMYMQRTLEGLWVCTRDWNRSSHISKAKALSSPCSRWRPLSPSWDIGAAGLCLQNVLLQLVSYSSSRIEPGCLYVWSLIICSDSLRHLGSS